MDHDAAMEVLAERWAEQDREAGRFPCGCYPCPDCGEAACCLSGCENVAHGMIVNI